MSKLTFANKATSNLLHDNHGEQQPFGLNLPEDLMEQIVFSSEFWGPRTIDAEILANLRFHFQILGGRMPKKLRRQLANNSVLPQAERAIIGILRQSLLIREANGLE
jgi:hypothetical protein